MRNYELIVIISPEVSEESLPTTIDKVHRMITERGGAITQVDQWGRRKLAHPIGRFLEGNYVLTRFTFEPRSTAQLEAGLRLAEEVLRHLLVRLGDHGAQQERSGEDGDSE